MHRTHLSPEARKALEAGDITALIEHHRRTFGGVQMKADGEGDDSTPTRIDHSGDDPDGSDEGDDEPDEDDDAGDDPEDDDDDRDGDDDDLGEKGQKALERMKAERKELRKVIRDLKSQIAELRNGDDDEKDELETARDETKAERDKRIKAEKALAAHRAGLPESWADRLQGDDFEDFLDDAESLAQDLPTPRDRKGGGGAKEGHKRRKPPTLDDRIAEAEAKGDSKTVRALKAQKVAALAAAQG